MVVARRRQTQLIAGLSPHRKPKRVKAYERSLNLQQDPVQYRIGQAEASAFYGQQAKNRGQKRFRAMTRNHFGSIRCDRIFSSIGRVTLAAAMLSLAAPTVAVVNTGTDPEAELPYWELVEHGISIRLVQRLPDQTRGFFQARGFSVADSELIAQSCVFQTVFKNLSPVTEPIKIEYNLREWVVHAAGAKRAMKTREDWKKIWTGRRAPPAAQLAFEWSLLPTRQSYGPGDYNWGMSIYGLAPGMSFDLDIVWHQNGERRTARLKSVRCAPDIHPQPEAP